MIIVTLYTCLTTATEIISFPKFTISKLLKGRSEPRVGKVFGPNIPKVIRDPALVRFLDRTSVRSFGTPRWTDFWTQHLWGHSGPRVGHVFGQNICEVIRDPVLDRFLDRTSVKKNWRNFFLKNKIIEKNKELKGFFLKKAWKQKNSKQNFKTKNWKKALNLEIISLFHHCTESRCELVISRRFS